jgi:hypothetical protein
MSDADPTGRQPPAPPPVPPPAPPPAVSASGGRSGGAPGLPLSAQAAPPAPPSSAASLAPPLPLSAQPASVRQPLGQSAVARNVQQLPATAKPPAKKSAVSAEPASVHVAEHDQPPADPTQQAVKTAPPWLVSLVVHMTLVVALALLTIKPLISNTVELEVIPADRLGDQLINDQLMSPEQVEMQVEVPVLSLATSLADDPLAAPLKLDELILDPSRTAIQIDAPSIGMALSGRDAGMKKALLAAYGGTEATEDAVRLGLDWLKRHQLKDGGWSLAGPYRDGGSIDNRVAATAMALLAFQGAGHTHVSGDYVKEVQRGWDFLLRQQDLDGFFQQPGTGRYHVLYAQAQATIALCEIFGMTKDDTFRRPAQLALDFARKAQAPEGGWRYVPREDSDLSVTGWFVMAFQSGRMAGLDVQSPVLDKVSEFLDQCAVPDHGGARYAYRPGEGAKLSMTAEGLLCRQYLGWTHDDPRLKRGVDWLLQNRVSYADQNVYYWYYATQVCHHMDGDDWKRWNEVMRVAIPKAQVKTGDERGSWDSFDDSRGPDGGRLYVTCLSLYMLEVYYRHLPIYKWRLE